MRKIDDIIPELGFVPALILTVVIALALELSGVWVTMLVAGVIGSLFVRKTSHAFIVGLIGVAIAWSVLFLYLILTAQALAIAEFFIGLLGLSGLGGLVIAISIIIGGLLGGFGGLLGRSTVELIDELVYKDPVAQTEEPETDEGDDVGDAE